MTRWRAGSWPSVWRCGRRAAARPTAVDPARSDRGRDAGQTPPRGCIGHGPRWPTAAGSRPRRSRGSGGSSSQVQASRVHTDRCDHVTAVVETNRWRSRGSRAGWSAAGAGWRPPVEVPPLRSRQKPAQGELSPGAEVRRTPTRARQADTDHGHSSRCLSSRRRGDGPRRSDARRYACLGPRRPRSWRSAPQVVVAPMVAVPITSNWDTLAVGRSTPA